MLKASISRIITMVTFISLLLGIGALISLRSSETSYSEANDFRLIDIYGERFSLSEYSGRVVILEFMSLSCPICKQEISELKTINSIYGNLVTILSVSTDLAHDTDSALQAHADRYELNWRIARGTPELFTKFDVTELPTIVIFDEHGFVRARYVGFTSASTLIEKIDSILK